MVPTIELFEIIPLLFCRQKKMIVRQALISIMVQEGGTNCRQREKSH